MIKGDGTKNEGGRKYFSDLCHLVKCKEKKLQEIILNPIYQKSDWVLKCNHVCRSKSIKLKFSHGLYLELI